MKAAKRSALPLILLLLFCTISSYSQTAVGNYRSGYSQKGNVIFFSNDQADVQLEFCTSRMLRVRTSWSRTFEANEPWMVVNYAWPTVDIKTVEKNDRFELTTPDLVVNVMKTPFSIQVTNRDGKLVTSDVTANNKGGAWQNGAQVGCKKVLNDDEHFFGFGERMDVMDRRGKTLKLNVGRGEGMPHIIGAYNVLEANYCPVPFFMSTRGYGLFFHNAFPTAWDMGSADKSAYTFEAEGGELDYYIIYGPDFPSILDQYTNLTGKAPLMPLFAAGLHVGTYSGGTWGYEQLTSSQYVIELLKKFRTLGIPVDILHLDSTWRIFGENGGKGATSFEWRETFTDPKAMFDSLYAMHLNMAGLHIRSRFDNGKKLRLLDEARKEKFVYPEQNNPGEFVNFFDPKAVDWWWDHGVMNIASIGAKFLKTDEGSAFGHRANESDKTGPTGEEIKRLHNLFPLAYAKAPYEKFQAYNHLRGMNQTREGYAGIQRFPYIFAGDWPSEWQYFGPVIKAGLNIGISGVGNWAHCMGGFEHPADPELYIRWCQFGMFSPVAHVFGMDHPGYKEPWNYGEEALKNFKQYDSLRYRLIPYIYNHSYEMYKTGMPIMRALVLAYQNDENVYTIDDQYLFGKDMLICPVTTKGAQTRVVYLPEGNWIDYWTGRKYEGKKYYNVVTPITKLPIFIKPGAIIPMQPEVQYMDRKPWGALTLDVYPNGESRLDLYEDDGVSLDYQTGKYAITHAVCNDMPDKMDVSLSKPEGNFKVPQRAYQWRIHLPAAPKQVVVTSTKKKQSLKQVTDMKYLTDQTWIYDNVSGTVCIQYAVAAGTGVNIQLVK